MSAKSSKQNSDPQAAPSDKLAELVQQIEQLQQQLEQANSARVLVMADFDNYRKQKDVEKSKVGALTNMMLVQSLLEVIDDLYLAENDSGMDLERARQVLKLLEDKLHNAIGLAGVEKVEIKKGDRFDPALMESVTAVPASSPEQAGTVVDVISAPFRFVGQQMLLKMGKVVTAKAA